MERWRHKSAEITRDSTREGRVLGKALFVGSAVRHDKIRGVVCVPAYHTNNVPSRYDDLDGVGLILYLQDAGSEPARKQTILRGLWDGCRAVVRA